MSQRSPGELFRAGFYFGAGFLTFQLVAAAGVFIVFLLLTALIALIGLGS